MERPGARPRAAILWFLGLLASPALAAADPIADFYAGKTVTIMIGLAPGGTYDLYARTLARHIGRFIPGNPRVIVQNMPGAASYNAAAYVFNVAPQDGTAVAAIGAAIAYQPLIDSAAPKLDWPRVNWLGSVSTFNVMTVARADIGVNSIDDLRRRETVMATISPGQLPSLLVAAINAGLGAKVKGINGHASLNDAMVALERGEIDGYPALPVDSVLRLYGGLRGRLRMLLQYGPAPSAEFPEAAYAADLAKTPADRALIELAQAPLKAGYIYMAGPGVPKERVEALRAALLAVCADSEFRADAGRQTLNVAPITGDRVWQLIAEAYATPRDVVERMRGLYRRTLQ